jgi:hypothetical protein
MKTPAARRQVYTVKLENLPAKSVGYVKYVMVCMIVSTGFPNSCSG